MRRVELISVSKRFGAVQALDDVTLSVEPGEHLAVLGPSGSGKSTLLRIVAGLELPDAGDVRFDGVSQLGIEPHRRDVALVFQQYALYPHLTALGNITIGLRHGRRLSTTEAETRAREVAARLGIEDLLDRRPRAMSGGQRQRLALARALARQAGIVLLDEPLSGLDAQLRLTLRVEITGRLRATGATVVHVTHDQSDALTAADTVAVMDAGCIAQRGSPADLYDQPATLFVARFIGVPPINVFTTDSGLHLGVRPEHVRLDGLGRWTTEGLVVAIEHAGPQRIVHLTVGGRVVAVRTQAGDLPTVGSTVALSADPRHVHVFGADGRRIDTRREALAPPHDWSLR